MRLRLVPSDTNFLLLSGFKNNPNLPQLPWTFWECPILVPNLWRWGTATSFLQVMFTIDVVLWLSHDCHMCSLRVMLLSLNYNLILLDLGRWQYKAKNFVCNVSIALWQFSSGGQNCQNENCQSAIEMLQTKFFAFYCHRPRSSNIEWLSHDYHMIITWHMAMII